MLAIESSQEFRTDVIAEVYGQFLDRQPDPSGLAGWITFLNQGGTRKQLEARILGSPEYLARRGGGTDTGFLQSVYQDVLGRAPDPTGLAFWTQILANGDSEEGEEESASPARHQEVAASILQSLESSEDQVQTWYNQYLHRAADPTGLGALSKALQQGLSDESAIAVVIGSDEYFARAG